MNLLMSDPNTTPEQLITLFSSAIYSFGDRLGNASVDLLHSLLHSLNPETLTEEQKQLFIARLDKKLNPSYLNTYKRGQFANVTEEE